MAPPITKPITNIFPAKTENEIRILLGKGKTITQRQSNILNNIITNAQKGLTQKAPGAISSFSNINIFKSASNAEKMAEFDSNIAKMFNFGIKFSGEAPASAVKSLEEAMVQSVNGIVSKMGDDIRDSALSIVNDGIKSSALPNDISNQLIQELDISKARAETIARTETMRAANSASFAQAKANGYTHFIIDSRAEACDMCQDEYGGQVYTIEDDVDSLSPLHPNCACIPVYFDNAEEAQNYADDLKDEKLAERQDLMDQGLYLPSDGTGPLEEGAPGWKDPSELSNIPSLPSSTTESVKAVDDISNFLNEDAINFVDNFQSKRGTAKIEYGQTFNSKTGQNISGELKGSAKTVKKLSVNKIDNDVAKGADSVIHNHPPGRALSAPSPSDVAVAVESKGTNSIIVSERGKYLINTQGKPANPFYMELEMKADSLRVQQGVLDEIKAGTLKVKDDKELLNIVNKRYEEAIFERADKYGIKIIKW